MQGRSYVSARVLGNVPFSTCRTNWCSCGNVSMDSKDAGIERTILFANYCKFIDDLFAHGFNPRVFFEPWRAGELASSQQLC